ncbi:hypothetical protein [Actinacidiphila glaucinigra]|uniref:hypothetical protein n=1 Tax=Actinacidiphila glaucinigra TaxID=235986 RepID=UPI0036E8E44A
MNFRNTFRLPHFGAAALLAAAGLAVTGAPAHAEDQAYVALMQGSTQLAQGVTQAHAKPFQFHLVNFVDYGAVARNVTVTVDVSKLDRTRVGYVVPTGCAANAAGYTCRLGDMADYSRDFGVPLYSLGEQGAAGTLSVKVASTTPDPYLDDNSVDVPVNVAPAGSDLVPWVQDVYADVAVDGDDVGETNLTPVKVNHSVLMDWAIRNYGSRPVQGLTYEFSLPPGVTFAKQPSGCRIAQSDGYTSATCEQPNVKLQPGQSFTTDVNLKIGPNVNIGQLHGPLFFVWDPTGNEVDQGDADTDFEVFTRP